MREPDSLCKLNIWPDYPVELRKTYGATMLNKYTHTPSGFMLKSAHWDGASAILEVAIPVHEIPHSSHLWRK